MDVFDFYNWSQRKFVFHGSAVEIACACDELVPGLDHLLQPFREASFPDGFVPMRGTIEPYDLEDVLKHLSIKARLLPTPDQPFDLYRDGDKYFRLDDAVGLTMVDLVRRRWHCWVTPEAMASDSIRLADAAILWPLAQLVGQRDLQLLPGVAIARDGFGALLIGDLSLELELPLLLSEGFKIVGQRWVALREEEQGRIAMLHLPGHVLQKAAPRAPGERQDFQAFAAESRERWFDLHASHPQSVQHHAFCDLILVCSAGRREQICVKQVGWAGAMNVLRRAWPTFDLPPGRRGGKMVTKMASRVRVAELQLSRDPQDLIKVLDLMRRTPVPQHLVPPTVPAVSKMVTDFYRRPTYRVAKRSA